MANANPWGAPRIHGELLKPGIRISEAEGGSRHFLPSVAVDVGGRIHTVMCEGGNDSTVRCVMLGSRQ